MTNDEDMTTYVFTPPANPPSSFVIRHSFVLRHSSFVIHHNRRPFEDAQKKGHGTSVRRHTMTSILKRDDQMVIPPSRSLVQVLSAVARSSLKPILHFGRDGWPRLAVRHERTDLAKSVPPLAFLAGARQTHENGRVRLANSPVAGFL